MTGRVRLPNAAHAVRTGSVGVVLCGRLRTISLTEEEERQVRQAAHDRGMSLREFVDQIVQCVQRTGPFGRSLDATARAAGLTVSAWVRILLLTKLGRIELREQLVSLE